MTEKLLLIDANSLIHRAFHALPPLNAPTGETVNAVYGFLLALFKAIKEQQPTHIVAAFDTKAPTKRHEAYKAYKATRQKAPDELYAQFPRIKEALDAMGIRYMEHDGFEADDIIATLATEAGSRKGMEVVILTGDRDALQLVGGNVKVCGLGRGIQDTVLYDEKKVREKFLGVSPSQLADYKGLRGDPSDNIPGVPGIGEKTASALLNAFGSLEHLYERIGTSDLKDLGIKPSALKMLTIYKDQAFLSRELGTLVKDLSLGASIEECLWGTYNERGAREFLEGLGFRTLVSKLPRSIAGDLPQEEGILEQIERLREDRVLSDEVADLERRLVPVIASMEKLGIAVDVPYFDGLSKELETELIMHEKDIFERAGSVFNVNSPQQLAVVLFETLGLSTKGIRKTPGGVLSTASPELEKLEQAHPIIQAVLKYRELQKLQSTYLKTLPRMAQEDGRIHTTFHQLGAATGRISSSDPNLQNIPIQGEWGARIRKGFIAPKGRALVSFDYSQMELRIVAHLSGDKLLQETFREGKDVHRMTAAAVFNVPEEQVTKEMRSRAKALNFGIIYGMGSTSFARSAEISVAQAKEFIERYFAEFPGVRSYMDNVKAFTKENGYVETFLGRRRPLPEILSSAPQFQAAAERMAINHPVQGGAADIIKTAMVRLHETILSKMEDWHLLLQIHDELLFEVEGDVKSKEVEKIRTIMEDACADIVPLVVEVKQGPNWGELTSVDR